MRLSAFITAHMADILAEWDGYARTLTPAADGMTLVALRDHAEGMLRAIALDIETPQTEAERHQKSLGESDDASASSAASVHGRDRHASNFSLVQLSGEFRALRASVLRLWLEHVPTDTRAALEEVMRFNEALDQALAESVVTFSGRAEHARNTFDAILGHDLRGPLSTMALSGELLTRNELGADQARELGVRIGSAARYMASMVNDLLEFARGRLGGKGLPFKPRMQSLAGVCNEALDDAAAMHPESTFTIQVDPESPSEACIDAARIRQLLVNLLGNAGQHGTRGRPIQLHVGGDQDQVLLDVVNEGGRIPAESLARIFDPLVRLQQDASPGGRVMGGLGLGLHIAQEIARAHGGSIVASSDDRHTMFSVRLPRRGQEGEECA